MKQIKILTLALCFLAFLGGCGSDDEPEPQIVFTNVTINKVTVTAFPAKDSNGNDYDSSLSGTFPDVLFDLRKKNSATALFSLAISSRFENVQQAELPISWGNGTVYKFQSLEEIEINLFDYDSTSDSDYIGTVFFNLKDYSTGSNKFPASITKTNGATSITLGLSWGT